MSRARVKHLHNLVVFARLTLLFYGQLTSLFMYRDDSGESKSGIVISRSLSGLMRFRTTRLYGSHTGMSQGRVDSRTGFLTCARMIRLTGWLQLILCSTSRWSRWHNIGSWDSLENGSCRCLLQSSSTSAPYRHLQVTLLDETIVFYFVCIQLFLIALHIYMLQVKSSRRQITCNLATKAPTVHGRMDDCDRDWKSMAKQWGVCAWWFWSVPPDIHTIYSHTVNSGVTAWSDVAS